METRRLTSMSSAFVSIVLQVVKVLLYAQNLVYHEQAQQNWLPKHLQKKLCASVVDLSKPTNKKFNNFLGRAPITPRPSLPAEFQSLQNGWQNKETSV